MSVPHVDESDEYSVEEIGLFNCHNHIALAENILGARGEVLGGTDCPMQ